VWLPIAVQLSAATETSLRNELLRIEFDDELSWFITANHSTNN